MVGAWQHASTSSCDATSSCDTHTAARSLLHRLSQYQTTRRLLMQGSYSRPPRAHHHIIDPEFLTFNHSHPA